LGLGAERGRKVCVVWIGIFLLLSPETSATYFEAFRYGQLFYVYTSITLVIGIYLTFSSFRSPA
jgi:hypothetical protein